MEATPPIMDEQAMFDLFLSTFTTPGDAKQFLVQKNAQLKQMRLLLQQ
jgi:hypothetical protein